MILYPSTNDKLNYKISTLIEIENNGFIEKFLMQIHY